MSDYTINFTGWKAVAVIVVLLGVFGLRLMTFNDKIDDKSLMREIELQLMSDYFPDDVEELKAAMDSGDKEELERVANSIASTKLNVESVQTSYPLFSLSARKKVVVKVTYSLDDASGTRKKGTNYYLFRHGSIGNAWRYRHKTTVVSYYLNFV